MTLGVYPAISIDTARKMSRKALADIVEGINPNDSKRQFRAASVTLIEAFNAFMEARPTSLLQPVVIIK